MRFIGSCSKINELTARTRPAVFSGRCTARARDSARNRKARSYGGWAVVCGARSGTPTDGFPGVRLYASYARARGQNGLAGFHQRRRRRGAARVEFSIIPSYAARGPSVATSLPPATRRNRMLSHYYPSPRIPYTCRCSVTVVISGPYYLLTYYIIIDTCRRRRKTLSRDYSVSIIFPRDKRKRPCAVDFENVVWGGELTTFQPSLPFKIF